MPAPANDDFVNAITIAGPSGSDSQVIDLATLEASEPVPSASGQVNQTVWYKFTAPVDGMAAFDTFASDGGAMDTVLAAYTGASLASLVEVASGDDFGTYAPTSWIAFPVTEGTTYYIQAGTYNPGTTGTLVLAWLLPTDAPTDWTGRASDFDGQECFGCCWSRDLALFAVVGYLPSGGVATSPDGITWTDQTTDFSSFNSIIWVAELGLFIAGGASAGNASLIATSPDGVNWTTQVTPWDGDGIVNALAWSPDVVPGGLIVATGQNFTPGDTVMTSPDGLNWTTQDGGTFDPPASGAGGYGVCWAADLGLFIVVGSGGASSEFTLMTSPDGTTWTTQTTPFDDGGEGHGVFWSAAHNLAIAVGNDANSNSHRIVMTSPDGVVWTSQITPVDGRSRGFGVALCGERLVLVCGPQEFGGTATTAILESDDGTTWNIADTSPLDPPDGSRAEAICFSPELSLAVAVGAQGTDSVAIATARFVIPSPSPILSFGRFYEAPPWRFVVSTLEDELLTYLDHLGLDRSVTVTRAAARVADIRVPSDNPEVNIPAPDPDLDPFLSEGTRFLTGFRREGRWLNDDPWVVRFRGVILNLADGADSDHATSVATAYDPWKYLYRRPVLLADGTMPGDAGRVYPAGTRPEEIIVDQFQLAIDYGTTIFTDFGQTGFYDGTIENCDALTEDLTLQKGSSLGEMLDILAATGTCDPVFDPIYDVAARPGILCQLSIYRRAGSFKPNAVFSWDMFPRNVVALSRVTDGTERADQIQFYAGQGGPPVPLETDPAAIAKYGDYFAQQFFPGVASIGAVHLLAQRQLVLLANGQLTYTLSVDSGRAPVPFMEYREADDVPLNASKRFRAPISDLRLRVESLPIVIGDDQLERVNQILVSLETAPEA